MSEFSPDSPAQGERGTYRTASQLPWPAGSRGDRTWTTSSGVEHPHPRNAIGLDLGEIEIVGGVAEDPVGAIERRARAADSAAVRREGGEARDLIGHKHDAGGILEDVHRPAEAAPPREP